MSEDSYIPPLRFHTGDRLRAVGKAIEYSVTYQRYADIYLKANGNFLVRSVFEEDETDYDAEDVLFGDLIATVMPDNATSATITYYKAGGFDD